MFRTHQSVIRTRQDQPVLRRHQQGAFRSQTLRADQNRHQLRIGGQLRRAQGCRPDPHDRLWPVVQRAHQFPRPQVFHRTLARRRQNCRAGCETNHAGVVGRQFHITFERQTAAAKLRVVRLIHRPTVGVDGVGLVQNAIVRKVSLQLALVVVVTGQINKIVVGCVAVTQRTAVAGIEIRNRVVATRDHKDVVAIPTNQQVVAIPAIKAVIARATDDCVIATAANHRVVAIPGVDIVIAMLSTINLTMVPAIRRQGCVVGGHRDQLDRLDRLTLHQLGVSVV